MKVGNALFWFTSSFAALILLWAGADYLYDLSNNFPVLNTTALFVAGAVWLVGLCCRHAL